MLVKHCFSVFTQINHLAMHLSTLIYFYVSFISITKLYHLLGVEHKQDTQCCDVISPWRTIVSLVC